MQEENTLKETIEQETFKTYRTQEEWQQDIDGIIGKRLGELRETKEELENIKPIVESLMEEYGAENPKDICVKVKEREESVRSEAEKKSDRVNESALDGMNGFKISRDPSRFTAEELDDIARRVRNGERIEF